MGGMTTVEWLQLFSACATPKELDILTAKGLITRREYEDSVLYYCSRAWAVRFNKETER
jgi:hypothetical protein